MPPVQESFNPKPLAASGAIATGPCMLGGILCTAAGTVEVRHTDAAGAIAVVSFTMTVGAFHPMPFAFPNGAYATFGGGGGGTFAVV